MIPRSARWLAIVNPAAGNGAGGRLTGTLAAMFADVGIRVDVTKSPGPGEAARIASDGVADGLDRSLPMELDGEVSRLRSLSVRLRPRALRVLA